MRREDKVHARSPVPTPGPRTACGLGAGGAEGALVSSDPLAVTCLACRKRAAAVEVFDTSAPRRCPSCGALAVVPLPPKLLAEQRDGTTHVCLPAQGFGGCNLGFAVAPAVEMHFDFGEGVPVSMSARCKRCQRELRVFLSRVVDSDGDLDVVGDELVVLLRGALARHYFDCEGESSVVPF